MDPEATVSKKDDDKKKPCRACNGVGGAWVQPTDVSGNGKRQPGKQTCVICESCGGSGTV